MTASSLYISTGGTEIRVWDACAGGRLLAKLCQHHKTVTCLCLGSGNKRLLSGSLDRHVKIYDISSYQVVHTLDYPNAVLSLDVSVSIHFPSDHSEYVLLCHRAPSASSQNKCLWFTVFHQMAAGGGMIMTVHPYYILNVYCVTVTYKIFFFFKNYQNIRLWLILCG